MKKIAKMWLTVFAFLVVFIGVFAVNSNRVKADTTVDDFYFNADGFGDVYNGSSVEMKKSFMDVYVMTKGGFGNADEVIWSSSDSNIVSVSKIDSNTARFTRNGPGYARITARITKGNVYYSVSITVKVDVKIKREEDKDSANDKNYTNLKQISEDNQFAIVLDYCPDGSYVFPNGYSYTNEAKIFLQYTVNPELVNNSLLTWSTDNPDVVQVSKAGVVKAVGAGRAVVRITTNTLDSAQPIVNEVLVIVNPLVNTNIFGEQGQDRWVNSSEGNVVVTAASNFYIQSNALRADKLDWKVTDSNGNAISPNSSVMQYKIYTTSGAFEIMNAKVGVYHIQAFAEGLNAESRNVKYVDITIVVDFKAPSTITMNVGDTYDLMENLNMSTSFVKIESKNANIVSAGTATAIMRAKTTGTTQVILTYRRYVNGVFVEEDWTITVNVIDALSLNLSDATIYVNGSLPLNATVSDVTAKLTWTSSDTSVAVVDGDGLVTGLRPGECQITVSTKINGVYKSASCNIMVIASLTGIEIDPREVTLSIGDYKMLTAITKPANINNVEVKWVSSDPSIVQITETTKKTATIKAIAGGSAVITAINQNNVVVDFCKVTVKQPVTSITLSEKYITISLAAKDFQLRATVLPVTATDQRIKFTSTNSSVVRVDSEGKVTLVSAGTASIIVSSVDNPSVTDICNITVTTPVTGIVLDKTSLNMVVGDTERLTYTMIPTSASNQAVTWTSSDNAVCTVTSTGSVRAIAAGIATITITSEDGKYTKSCTVTVSQFASSISLDVKDLEISVGESYTFAVKTNPVSTTDTFTWEITNDTVATVDKNGKVTGKMAGTTLVIVKSNRGLTAYCNIKVSQKASGIELNYAKKTVIVSNKFTLLATVTPENTTEQAVIYESSDPKIATVSKNGVVKGISGGTAIITVTSIDGGFKKNCIVTVKELITSIKLPSSVKVGKGKSHVIKANITTNNATVTKLLWSSSNTKIATVDKNGKIKAKAYGKVKITAKATDGSGAKATTNVQVVRPITSISMNKATLTIVEGNTKKLTASVKPTNATIKSLNWTSSDESIAIVDSKGRVTGLKAGTVTVKATAKDGSKKSTKCIVTVVKKVASTSVTVADQSVVLVTGENKTVQAVMSPANTTDSYKWSSDNNAVATVDKNSGRIIAKSIGTAIITVMTDSGKTARITVNVVGLSKSSLVLEQYSTHTLWVEGETSNITWDVENPNIATISNGRITARATGKTNVIAIVNGRRLYCRLTVTKIN